MKYRNETFAAVRAAFLVVVGLFLISACGKEQKESANAASGKSSHQGSSNSGSSGSGGAGGASSPLLQLCVQTTMAQFPTATASQAEGACLCVMEHGGQAASEAQQKACLDENGIAY